METHKIQQRIQKILSEKRYLHSLGVAEEAQRLAVHYGAAEEKAYLAGLLHDCAKEIPEEQALAMLNKYGVQIDEIVKRTPRLLHGPLGACISQVEFEITDPEILDAIRFHTTGKANMNLLTKIIYIADYIEPNRRFEGVEELRVLAYDSIDRAIIAGIDYTIEDLIQSGLALHPDTIHARNYLLLCK